jgi:serine/threonine-protein kinase
VDEGRFPPGTLLAQRYRIVNLLGRGGMGEVYRASDLLLGQTVALKFLPPAATANEAALGRFRNEVRTARQVSHPNVCRVYDIGEADGLTYLSMEYVDGEDLRSLLHRIGKLPQDKALEIARKTCAGLAAAHDKGVIHRDLKPANIMLDGQGQVRITDFGLAGFAEQVRDVRSGTPAYMAPEQKAGKEVTARSDIYALGVVLHEVFTGKRPSEGSKPELDLVVDRVIHHCLDPDPQRRPATALAVSAALPGGDPLAMALAAGQTPTPEMVAAAGETQGMRPVWAVACLVLVIAGLIGFTLAQQRLHLLNRVPLPYPPEALAARARDLLERCGYTRPPFDTARGFRTGIPNTQEYLKSAQGDPRRWERIFSGSVPLIGFWYRESPEYPLGFWPTSLSVSAIDPPVNRSGMALVQLTPGGVLLRMEVIPNRVEKPAPPAPPFNWAMLLTAAGADLSTLKPVEPEWTPASICDERKAWTGPYPGWPEVTARFEAAAWRGRPVYFEVLPPWVKSWRQEAPETSRSEVAFGTLVLALLSALLSAAGWMAWRNFRLGRGDVRGALRLAAFVFAAGILGAFLPVSNLSSIKEVFLVLRWVLERALLPAAFVFLFYLALEPYVRRRWPHTLVAWNRLLAGKINDPLVGRDLLVGAVLGAAWCLTGPLDLEGSPHRPVNLPLGLEYLSHQPLCFAGEVLSWLPFTLFIPVLLLLLLSLFRAFLRRDWAAFAALAGLCGVYEFVGTADAWSAPGFPVFMLALAICITRFGLLAGIFSYCVFWLLFPAPLTFDFSRWYAPYSAATLVLVLLLALFAFKTALGSRKLFKTDLFAE